jgi:mannitol/fructose-specific phosphotransferase system IIA component (Ntr-type)
LSLGTLVRQDLIFPDVPAAAGPELLRAFAERIAARGVVRSAEELFQRLWEREQQGSTGIGGGVAIPHCKLPGLRHGVVAVGTVPGGVELAAADGEPVRLFFLVLSPDEAPAEHLRSLAAISRWLRWLKATGNAERLLASRDPAAVYDLLCGEED